MWSPIININITWELLRNAVSQVPPQTYWIRICVLPITPMICILKFKMLHDSPCFPYLQQQVKLLWDDTIKYWYPKKVKVKVLVSQSCLTLCDSMDCEPPGSSVHGILQARILNGLPFPSPGYLPDPGSNPASLASPALAGRFFTTAPPGKPRSIPVTSA